MQNFNCKNLKLITEASAEHARVGKVERLDRGARYHAENVRQAREGRRLPQPPAQGSTEQRPPAEGEPGFEKSGAGAEDSPAAKAEALGDAALEAGDYAAASENFELALSAIKSVPNGGWGEASLRCKRGIALRLLNDFAAAETELKSALALFPRESSRKARSKTEHLIALFDSRHDVSHAAI